MIKTVEINGEKVKVRCSVLNKAFIVLRGSSVFITLIKSPNWNPHWKYIQPWWLISEQSSSIPFVDVSFIDGKTERRSEASGSCLLPCQRWCENKEEVSFQELLSWANKQYYLLRTVAPWKSLLIPTFVMGHLVIWITYWNYCVSHRIPYL